MFERAQPASVPRDELDELDDDAVELELDETKSASAKTAPPLAASSEPATAPFPTSTRFDLLPFFGTRLWPVRVEPLLER